MESVLFGSIVKGTLLLLTAFGLTWALLDASAAARHAIWSAALVGVIAIPLLIPVLSGDEDPSVRQVAAWALGAIE